MNPTVKISEFKDHWALVTGASSGIGQEFARQLARAGLNLVLVARRKPLLEALASSLSSDYGVQTRVVAMDLAQPNAAAGLKRNLSRAGIHIRLLCNNAGMGRWGHFQKTLDEFDQQMVTLNSTAVISMCHQFFEDLVSFPTSAVINVSSSACYQPVPFMATYAATKAFVQSFSQALYGEWKDRGILVQTLVPGPTATEFDTKAGAYESALTKRDSPAKVVEASLAGLKKGAPVVVAAKGTYLQRFFAGLFPARLVIREVSKMFRPPQDQ